MNAILILKTNLVSQQDIEALEPILNNHYAIEQWSVDLEDVDSVMRIISNGIQLDEAIQLLRDHGYHCEELI